MKQQYYTTILSKMFTTKKDAYHEHHIMLNFSFYDFWNKEEISKEAYEQTIIELVKSGYITITPRSNTSYDGAIIKITKEGVIYANENK